MHNVIKARFFFLAGNFLNGNFENGFGVKWNGAEIGLLVNKRDLQALYLVLEADCSLLTKLRQQHTLN